MLELQLLKKKYRNDRDRRKNMEVRVRTGRGQADLRRH